MNKPSVSICIPVYNAEKTIASTIQSVLDQTFQDWQLIIVDNCSTDKTLDVVKTFTDKRIRLFQNETNCGMVNNWNKCLEKADTDYIQLLCADDELEKDCIERKYKFLSEHENLVAVFGGTFIINEENKIILKRRHFSKDCIINGNKIIKTSFRTKNIFGEPSNVMFKRTAMQKAGIFLNTLPYSPDWEYWLRLAQYGDFAFLKDYLVRYRVSSGNETSNLFKKKDILKKDEKTFINAVCVNPAITKFDVLIHRLNIFIRFYARIIFLAMFAR